MKLMNNFGSAPVQVGKCFGSGKDSICLQIPSHSNLDRSAGPYGLSTLRMIWSSPDGYAGSRQCSDKFRRLDRLRDLLTLLSK